uniref:VCBS repeat-containing protein n=1 Tax=candidate division WOR-3 bacterium TaxID=2052148 RepID=A0A7C3Z2U7_UNCW3
MILFLLFAFTTWDTIPIFSAPNFRLGKVLSARQLKGVNDDTARVFLCDQDTGNLYLLTDTASFYPLKFRREDLGLIGGGYLSVGCGDLDRNSRTDLFLGKMTSPFSVVRIYWEGGWRREVIANFGEPIYDLVVGDCDNDGELEVIFGCYNNLRMLSYGVSGWDTLTILRNTGTIKGVGIGDFDPLLPGNEIALTLPGGRIKRVYWNGLFWDTLTIFNNSSLTLTEMAVGDFDANSSGEEICVINTSQPLSLGSLIEIYYDYGFNSRVIFRPQSIPLIYSDLAVGDFYDGSAGKEILAITLSGTDNHCRMVYGRGGEWQNSVIFSTGPNRIFYGVFVGEGNRHRSYNEEILVTVGGRLYLIQEYSIPPPVIRDIYQPIFPLIGETLNIRAKIFTDYDSLQYLFDTLYLSLDGVSFSPRMRDSFRFSDSFFFYSLLPANRYFYYLRVRNRLGLFAQSSLRVLTPGYSRRIYEIQYTNDTSGISPDTNKWVITTGIVSGVFGNNFFMEERGASGFRGIFIRSFSPLFIGDSVKISGRVFEDNNLTTILMIPDSGSSLSILGRGISLSPPIIGINALNESLEGVLVKIDTLHFKRRGFFRANEGVWAYNSSESESILVWIDGTTNIPGQPIPETEVLLTGNIAQVGPDFQIRPRARSDFTIYPPGIGEEKRKERDKEKKIGFSVFDCLGRRLKGFPSRPGVYLIHSPEKRKIVIIRGGENN